MSELNLYKEGDLTHYNQQLVNCTLDRCWRECLVSSRYNERMVEVQHYNRRVYSDYLLLLKITLLTIAKIDDEFCRENRYKKKGLAIVPTKFGIAFTALILNQAGALVHIYTDGSVLISHGGIEMGQGLHTKMIQVRKKYLHFFLIQYSTLFQIMFYLSRFFDQFKINFSSIKN